MVNQHDTNDQKDIASYDVKLIVREHTNKQGKKYLMAHIYFVDALGEVHPLFKHFIRDYQNDLMELFSKLNMPSTI